MKKFFVMLFILMMTCLLMLPTVALAEEAATGVPTEPFTWQYLATIAGATAATLLIVQFLKVPLDKVWKIPTRIFVYIVALAVMVLATAFTTGITLDSVGLIALNAFVVALTAYGSYEVTFGKKNTAALQETTAAIDLNIEHWSLDQLKGFCTLSEIDATGCVTREDYMNAIESQSKVEDTEDDT